MHRPLMDRPSATTTRMWWLLILNSGMETGDYADYADFERVTQECRFTQKMSHTVFTTY